jgi:hypothetical protein
MDTMLVRLKAYDPRRGHVLKRYTYKGLKFLVEKGWYRVTLEVAEYLAGVRQVAYDEISPSAFEVCTEAEARALDEAAKKEEVGRKNAAVELPLSPARGERVAFTTADLTGGAHLDRPLHPGTDAGAPRHDAGPAPTEGPDGAGAAKGRKDKGG